MKSVFLVTAFFLAASACGGTEGTDSGTGDGGSDASDAALDAADGSRDGSADAGSDAGRDGGSDSGAPDGGVDTGVPRPVGDYPAIYGFRIRPGSPDRVYFESTEAVTATATAGFIISGKSISAITVNEGARDGHYFTVTEPFTYWDNNTIRYEGGSDLEDTDGNPLYDFTLRYIENDIPEPAADDNVYYVDATVASSGDGSSEAEAFRTMNEAASIARAGSTIWVKAGDYGNEQVVLAYSGTAAAPVKLIGYENVPGDSPRLTRSIGMSFDSSKMPLLVGGGRAAGITADGRYTIIRNMQVEGYTDLIMGQGRDLLFSVLDNVYLRDGETGVTVNDRDSQNVRVLHSYVADCTGRGIRLQNKHNLIDDVWSVSSRVVHQDYYIVIYGGVEGGDNIVRNSYVRRFNDDTHTGHGISLKGGDPSFTHEHNLIEGCEVVNSNNGSIEFRHSAVMHNVARDIYIHQESPDYATYRTHGINFENGCSYNRVENSRISARDAVTFVEGTEDGSSTQAGGIGNVIINSVIYDSFTALGVYSPTVNTDNLFINCTFDNNEVLITQLSGTSTNMLDASNEFINCSFSGTPLFKRNGNPSPTFRNSNFFDNWGPEGSDSSTDDPRFVDVPGGDFTPGNAALQRGTPHAETPYDIDDRERAEPSTLGAFERE